MAQCHECGEEFTDWSLAERLAEMIAEGDTDAALETLHELAPFTVSPPAILKRRVADRRAQAPLRSS